MVGVWFATLEDVPRYVGRVVRDLQASGVPLAEAVAWEALRDEWRERSAAGVPDVSEEMHLVLWEIEQGEAGAMKHADMAGRAHPDPGLFWFRVGQSFEAAGRSDEAIAALSRAHEADPGRPGAAPLLSALLETRGLRRALSGDTAGARPDLEAAVRLDGTNAAACLNLAVVLAGVVVAVLGPGLGVVGRGARADRWVRGELGRAMVRHQRGRPFGQSV